MVSDSQGDIYEGDFSNFYWIKSHANLNTENLNKMYSKFRMMHGDIYEGYWKYDVSLYMSI